MKRNFTVSLLLVCLMALVAATLLYGQRPGDRRPPGPPPGGRPGPGGRMHTANKQKELKLVRASEDPPAKSKVSISEYTDSLKIRANGIPKHKVGPFPNKGNPHEITEQGYDIVIPGDPIPAKEITLVQGGPGPPMIFGITLDGVMMEPGTAEFWHGDRRSGWNYEALGGAVPLGLDTNYAHVQPDGNYHYHGIPTGLMKRLGFKEGQHSPMIGWAADGFPVYALYGYSEAKNPSSRISELKTSYRLKKGSRPRGDEGPGGKYDGAFVQDYEFVADSGDLDECNGRFCVTPEFPDGTYAYFLSKEWPVIPRAFRGKPAILKKPGGRRPPGPPPGGPGGGRRPPPPQ